MIVFCLYHCGNYCRFTYSRLPSKLKPESVVILKNGQPGSPKLYNGHYLPEKRTVVNRSGAGVWQQNSIQDSFKIKF